MVETGDADEYQPGVCNIGTEERERRRRAGHLGTAAGLLLIAAVALLDLPPYYALASSVFFIAGATGYLQDRFHFCAYYGNRGEYNLGPVEDGPAVVTEEDAKAADKRRARQIMVYSLVTGIGAAVVGTGLLYVVF